MKKIISSICIMLLSSAAIAQNDIYGNVTFDKSGKKFIKVDVLDIVQSDGTTEAFARIHTCKRLDKTKYSCKEINPLNSSTGYEISRILQDNFLGYPQPQYIDYDAAKYTIKYSAGGAAVGSLGILGGALVVGTVPLGALIGSAIGGIRDLCAYYSRESLIKDLSAGTYRIDDFEGLEIEINRSLSNI